MQKAKINIPGADAAHPGMTEDEYKMQEIISLEASLSSTASDIGDWRIAKSMEYWVMGLEPPYDMAELHQRRQEVRDRINELQEEIARIEGND